MSGATGWRSPRTTAFLVVAYGVFGSLPFLPDGVRISGAPPGLSAFVLGGMIVQALVACAIVLRWGIDSAAYRPLSLIEPAWWTWGSLALIVSSGSVVSIYWVAIGMFVVLMATTWMRHSYYRALLAIGGAGAVVAFLVRGKPTDAVAAGVLLAVLLLLQGTSTVTSRQADENRARAELMSEGFAKLESERERQRIARDLHDGLGSELTELLWRAARLDSEASREVTAAVQRSMATLREVVAPRATEPVDAPVLLRELERVARLLGGGAGIPVAFEGTGTAVVPGDVAEALQKACPELIRNAVVHGRASCVTVRVDLDRRVLEVEDDGTWLEQPAGHGLANLTARAEALGGGLERVTGDAGTCIRLSFTA